MCPDRKEYTSAEYKTGAHELMNCTTCKACTVDTTKPEAGTTCTMCKPCAVLPNMIVDYGLARDQTLVCQGLPVPENPK